MVLDVLIKMLYRISGNYSIWMQFDVHGVTENNC